MGNVARTTLTERQRYWLEQVRACEASGKTVAEYAAEQGFSAQALYAGKKLQTTFFGGSAVADRMPV